MPQEIEAPDGTIIEFPDGMAVREIENVMAKQYPAPASKKAKPSFSNPVDINLQRFQNLKAQDARKAYSDARTALTRKITDPTKQKAALARFDTDPRIQAIRQIAGLQPVTTKRADLQDVAKRARAARSEFVTQTGRRAGNKELSDYEAAGRAGLLRGAFGVPERLVAAGLYYGGRSGNFDYDETLQAVRAATDADRERSVAGDLVGQLTSGLATGGAAGKLIGGGAARLVASSAPTAARAGNIIQTATTLQKGQRFRNVAKIAGAGAAGGGAQAAGEGSDVKTGLAVGAIGAPVVHGLTKGTIGTARGLRAIVGKRPAGSVLKGIIDTPIAVIEANLAKARADGTNPTIYEVLPLGDRQAFDEAVSKMPPASREAMFNAVHGRAENMVTETTDRTRQIIKPQSGKIAAQIAKDLAASRGSARANRSEIDLAKKAARSSRAIDTVAKTEARNIMSPYDDRVAYENVSDMLPQHPESVGPVRLQKDTGLLGENGQPIIRESISEPTIKMVPDNPDVASLINNEAGLLRIADRPVTIRDVTDIMSELSSIINKTDDNIQRGAAIRAVQHLEDILARDHPDVLPAVQKMRATYAARMRMKAGFVEGKETRLAESVDPRSARAEREIDNAYETSEGASGRTIGQASELESQILRSPSQSLGTLNQIATNPTMQQAIAQNLGDDTAGSLTSLARTQSENARRLGKLVQEQTGEASNVDPVHLMQSLLMLSPNTLPATKVQGILRTVRQFTRLPEKASTDVVNMLISQNPAQISRAIGILAKTGEPGRKALHQIAISVGAQSGGAAARTPEDTYAPASLPTEAEPEQEIIEEVPTGGESPYAQDLQEIYDSESPELLDLISRVEQQESGGNQNAVSSAGAIGVMQVMPETAPEAAKLAGLPWDEQAYYTDESYNKLLGIAYLTEMLRRYDGDVELALIAYNAGPGRADAYANGSGNLPAETRDYLTKIM